MPSYVRIGAAFMEITDLAVRTGRRVVRVDRVAPAEQTLRDACTWNGRLFQDFEPK